MAEDKNDGHKSGKSTKVKVEKMNGLQPQPSVPVIHDLLGQKLKAYYAEIASEPIPERLTALLAKLEAQTEKKKQS